MLNQNHLPHDSEAHDGHHSRRLEQNLGWVVEIHHRHVRQTLHHGLFHGRMKKKAKRKTEQNERNETKNESSEKKTNAKRSETGKSTKRNGNGVRIIGRRKTRSTAVAVHFSLLQFRPPTNTYNPLPLTLDTNRLTPHCFALGAARSVKTLRTPSWHCTGAGVCVCFTHFTQVTSSGGTPTIVLILG